MKVCDFKSGTANFAKNILLIGFLFSLRLSISSPASSLTENYKNARIQTREGDGALWLRGNPIGILSKFKHVAHCTIAQCGICMYVCTYVYILWPKNVTWYYNSLINPEEGFYVLVSFPLYLCQFISSSSLFQKGNANKKNSRVSR